MPTPTEWSEIEEGLRTGEEYLQKVWGKAPPWRDADHRKRWVKITRALEIVRREKETLCQWCEGYQAGKNDGYHSGLIERGMATANVCPNCAENRVDG